MNDMLPPEMVNEVLRAVPPTYQAVAARVCRAWRDLIVRAGRSRRVRYPQLALCAIQYSKGEERRPLANMLSASAMCGSAALFVWSVEQGCPHAHYVAARRGDARALERLGPATRRQSHSAVLAAASEGNVGMLEWMAERGGYRIHRTRPCMAAAMAGKVDVLRWLRGRGCFNEHGAAMLAAARGHVGVLQWVHGEGLLVGEALECAMQAAVICFQPDSLEWLWGALSEHSYWPSMSEMAIGCELKEAAAWFSAHQKQ